MIPTVIREAPNYSITLPMTGQFLTLAARATGPIPPTTDRVAVPSSESPPQHVASSRRRDSVIRPIRSRVRSRLAPAAVLHRQLRKAVRPTGGAFIEISMNGSAILQRLMAVLLRGFSADWRRRWRRGRAHDDTRTWPYRNPRAPRASGPCSERSDRKSPPISPPLALLLHPRHAGKEDVPSRHRPLRITSRRATQVQRSLHGKKRG